MKKFNIFNTLIKKSNNIKNKLALPFYFHKNKTFNQLPIFTNKNTFIYHPPINNLFKQQFHTKAINNNDKIFKSKTDITTLVSNNINEFKENINKINREYILVIKFILELHNIKIRDKYLNDVYIIFHNINNLIKQNLLILNSINKKIDVSELNKLLIDVDSNIKPLKEKYDKIIKLTKAIVEIPKIKNKVKVPTNNLNSNNVNNIIYDNNKIANELHFKIINIIFNSFYNNNKNLFNFKILNINNISYDNKKQINKLETIISNALDIILKRDDTNKEKRNSILFSILLIASILIDLLNNNNDIIVKIDVNKEITLNNYGRKYDKKLLLNNNKIISHINKSIKKIEKNNKQLEETGLEEITRLQIDITEFQKELIVGSSDNITEEMRDIIIKQLKEKRKHGSEVYILLNTDNGLKNFLHIELDKLLNSLRDMPMENFQKLLQDFLQTSKFRPTEIKILSKSEYKKILDSSIEELPPMERIYVDVSEFEKLRPLKIKEKTPLLEKFKNQLKKMKPVRKVQLDYTPPTDEYFIELAKKLKAEGHYKIGITNFRNENNELSDIGMHINDLLGMNKEKKQKLISKKIRTINRDISFIQQSKKINDKDKELLTRNYTNIIKHLRALNIN